MLSLESQYLASCRLSDPLSSPGPVLVAATISSPVSAKLLHSAATHTASYTLMGMLVALCVAVITNL